MLSDTLVADPAYTPIVIGDFKNDSMTDAPAIPGGALLSAYY